MVCSYEVKAAALKSCAGRPSASSGASLDFALTSHASLLGYIYIERERCFKELLFNRAFCFRCRA
jgi:hypothetical protein